MFEKFPQNGNNFNANNKEKNGDNNSVLKSKLQKTILVVFILLFIPFLLSLFQNIKNDINQPIQKNFSIQKIKNLNSSRSFHQSSKLKDGKILITGGVNPNNLNGLKTTEIFDPQTNTFTIGPEMNLPHFSHKQYSLKNGNVIIADINGIELYNYEKKRFELFKDKPVQIGNMPKATSFVMLPNENILVTGGYNNSTENSKSSILNTAEIIDVKNKTIKKINNLNEPRFMHSAITLKNGKTYILGGLSYCKEPIPKCATPFIEEFDPTTNSFKRIGTINIKTELPYISPTNNNDFIIFGGNSYYKPQKYDVPPFQIFNNADKKVKTVNTNNRYYFGKFFNVFSTFYENQDSNEKYFICFKPSNYGYGFLGAINTEKFIINLSNVLIPNYSNLIFLNDKKILLTGGVNINKYRLNKALSFFDITSMPTSDGNIFYGKEYYSNNAYIINLSENQNK